MTPKQRRFVDEYLVDGNGSRAAVAAGYGRAGARVAACRALANDNVQDALQARQAADATRLSLRREDALQGLLDGIELARAQGNPAAMISGWREIGRMLGFYEPDRAEVVVGVVDESRLMTSMNLMTDAELVALIAGQS
jgi:phosphoribosylaminoimidazole (AIR) synthetase